MAALEVTGERAPAEGLANAEAGRRSVYAIAIARRPPEKTVETR